MFEQVFEHVVMAMTAPERADPARQADPRGAGERLEHAFLPVLAALVPLLPQGALRRGSTVAVAGSTSLLFAVLAGPSMAGSWCAVIGMPALGLVAAAEAGVVLDRLALVPAPGQGWPGVTAALLDALDLVVIAPGARVRDGDARRLAARARQRGSVLVPFGVPAGGWEGADLRLSVDDAEWDGLGDGQGHLRARRALVRCDGRGSAARPRRARMWLPAAGGGVAPATAPAAAAGAAGAEVVPIPARRAVRARAAAGGLDRGDGADAAGAREGLA
jgi:hypothetical protein